MSQNRGIRYTIIVRGATNFVIAVEVLLPRAFGRYEKTRQYPDQRSKSLLLFSNDYKIDRVAISRLKSAVYYTQYTYVVFVIQNCVYLFFVIFLYNNV